SARVDRGTVAVSHERIERLRQEHGFDGYFETSAKEGLHIAELLEAALAAIAWPQATVAPIIFERIQKFLKTRIEAGLVLSTPGELRVACSEAWMAGGATLPPLFEEKFDECVRLLE